MVRTSRYIAWIAAAAVLMAACGRGDADTASDPDSALSRDLTLASTVDAPMPQLRDTADSTIVEKPEPAPPVRRTPAPVRTPTRQAPKPVAPTPQPEPQPPIVETPAPTPTPAPEPASRGVIAAGTTVGLTLDSRACSDANRVGDKMIAHTSEAVTGTDGVVFPAGSTVVIEIANVVQSGSADSSTITFRVKSITANDATHVATGDVVPTGTLEKKRVETKSADKKKVIGGAILGAIVGKVAGGGTKGAVIGAAAGAAAGTAAAAASARYETCVPAGAPLRLTIGAPV